MDFSEIKNKGKAELQEMLSELKTEMRELRFKALTKQLKTVDRVRKVRQSIAQISTLLNQK